MNSINRRLLLAGGAAGVLSAARIRRDMSESTYRLTTADWNIRIAVEFHDRQSSKTFAFLDRTSGRDYCLSGRGEENLNCLRDFVGSIAIAHYRIEPRRPQVPRFAVQEKVRTIDADSRLPDRPPFERRMETERGVMSDIQAFGYEASDPAKAGDAISPSKEPWSLLRQDLFIEGHSEPFLVIHWKHTLSAIRILDLIPGSGTILAEPST
jgi:hypothetical protein